MPRRQRSTAAGTRAENALPGSRPWRSWRASQCRSAGGPWLLSCPVIVSAGFYALWGAILRHPAISLTLAIPGGPDAALPFLGALLFGAASGMARERSESIAVSILLRWIGVPAVVLALYVGHWGVTPQRACYRPVSAAPKKEHKRG